MYEVMTSPAGSRQKQEVRRASSHGQPMIIISIIITSHHATTYFICPENRSMQIFRWQHLFLVQSLLRTVSVAAFSVTCYVRNAPVSRPSHFLLKSSSGTVLAAKYKTFDEMLENHSDVPLLIDFYSPFCGPCKVRVCLSLLYFIYECDF